MRSPVVVLASVITFAGCGGGELLGPELIPKLTVVGGCADVLFYAADESDELMLTFRAEGVVSQARSAGEGQETVITFVLPAPAVGLILQQGKRITGATRTDVIANGGPRVSRSWTAIAGTATMTIRPEPGQETAPADLLLEDVVLERSDGDQITIDRFAWEDISVGWYAG